MRAHGLEKAVANEDYGANDSGRRAESVMSPLRRVLVDGPGSVGARARQRRWDTFIRIFPNFTTMSVLDLGGTPNFWEHVPQRPRLLHIINLASASAPSSATWMRVDIADACDVPHWILDQHYDLVFSNSVIEHVGGHLQRQRFADQVRRAADQYWIQTPYRYFPVEPHWAAPGMQFLPLRARASMSRRWPLTPGRTPGRRDSLLAAVDAQMSVELLDITQMRSYFPESQLVYERFGPFVKSIIAVKSP